MREKLETADAGINDVYKNLINSLPAEQGHKLRQEQRKWMKQRNNICKLGVASTQKRDWLATLSLDKTKAACVLGALESRLRDLRVYQIAPFTDGEKLIERRELTFPIGHSTGKWYVEVEFLAKNYDKLGPFIMQVGASTQSSLNGMEINGKNMAYTAGSDDWYRVGLAIDLDNGKVYWSENGKWKSGEPGSSGGSDLKLGQSYSFRVKSSGPSLSHYVDAGSIQINAGATPFKYPIPAGYFPYYSPSLSSATVPGIDWIVPAYKKTQAKDYSEWVAKYWAWLLKRDPKRRPTEDMTGQYCADGQTGPVWFLAGADAAQHVERNCVIPQGQFILLPVMAQIMLSTAGATPCEKLVVDGVPQDGMNAITTSQLIINGLRLDQLDDFKMYTPRCISIVDSLGNAIVSDAVYWGTWVMLNPLPKGGHVISFGGELPATKVFRNVTYNIRIE